MFKRSCAIYIHVPFCAGACDYCDFYSIPVKPDDSRLELFVENILDEGEKLFQKYQVDNVPTVFIGGGTPSILGPVRIRRLLKGLSFLIAGVSPPPEEITMEANPESADEAFLAAIREEGVTRLSLGVQTFHEASRRAVNRTGDGALLPRRLSLAASYFPGSFSADLISGLPLQTEKVLLDDIAALIGYKPAHISLYDLTVKKESHLAARDRADALWLCGRDALEKSGYGQYEVSNFCLDGKQSIHNLRYWHMRNWLAIGPAASGTIIDDETGRGIRYTVPPDADRWMAADAVSDIDDIDDTIIEELDTLTLIKETFLMGFRCIEGPDEELFHRRFRRGIADCIPKTIEAWRSFLQDGRIALTKEGLLFLDPFLVDVFRELDSSFPPC